MNGNRLLTQARAGLLALLAACATAPGASAHHSASAAAFGNTGTLDLTKLSIGDGKWSTAGARRGYVYVCTRPGGMSGAAIAGPWISGKTWSLPAKVQVPGSVDWPAAKYKITRTSSKRLLKGNGLPRHTTGTYPIPSTSAAYTYDRNPNSIKAQTVSYTIPRRPSFHAKPSCTSGGPVGVLDSGAALFNALDAGGADAAAREIQDSCDGHPQQQGVYHYHSLPRCLYTGAAKKPSNRIGWALDGYPIYGPRGTNGKYLRNTDLDACHGTTSVVKLDGAYVRTYHYVATNEFPYTVACFRGTAPARTAPPAGGGPPGGGPPM